MTPWVTKFRGAFGILALFACVFPGVAWSEPASPQYAEEADGTSSLWVQMGPVGWLRDRGPLTDLVPMAGTVGFSHQIGQGRLAWRATLAHREMGDASVSFVYLDFISVERVFGDGMIRPFGRVALGFGLDLQGLNLSLGDDGYFNEDNGATGGLGVTFGSGMDVRLGAQFYWRVEGGIRAYGGVGQTGVLWDAQTGFGFDL
jgi:hypothetical protein